MPREAGRVKPVAIVGLSALFPEAEDVRAYWENIVAGRDCIREVPPSRWLIDDHYDPDPTAPDRTYSKRGGFVPEVDFDSLEWGLPPNSLEVTDVAQLLSLVLAKRAFADAGYGSGGRAFDRERAGVVLGVGGGQKLITPLTSRLQEPVWRRALETSGVTGPLADLIVEKIAAAYIGWQEDAFPGLLGNVIAGRIANRFDLGGINCVVDAACASSFAALRMALDELAEHRADLMLTGGVDADNSPFMYLCFSKTPAFSRANRTRPFDAASDGMLVGEGLGMLVLKRLADAERDGDRIYAVIRGLGASSDGRYKSIYAPRTEGQERALRRAYAAAGVAPASIGLVEAHGTGTVAGDLCEVETLRRVLDGADSVSAPHIALGSVKSQIGHTKAAAGAAGIIKAALALHHKVLPPTINVDQPNPALDLTGSSLYLNVEARPWMRRVPDTPRRAGVSAFGFGGTNFHVVLEEHEREQHGPYRLHASEREVLLAAATPLELAERCTVLAAQAAGCELEPLLAAAAVESIPDAAARVAFVVTDVEECAVGLRLTAQRIEAEPDAEAWHLSQGIHYRRRSLEGRPRIAALFPGQGSQYVGMGRTLALTFPPVRERLTALDSLFLAAGESPLSASIYPPTAFDAAERAAQEARLQNTSLAQPAIGALSAAMFALLQDAGLEPDFVAGHSFGELTALWAAGAMDDNVFLSLARERGRAMTVTSGADAGAMLAVSGDSGSLAEALAGLDGVVVANVNAADQTVVAGPSAAITEARRQLAERGYTTTPLPVAAAFHTPLVAHAQAPFAAAVQAAGLRVPRIPVFATATGETYPGDAGEVAAQLAEQLVRPVQWVEQVEALYAAGARVFVEVGPRSILTSLVRRILAGRAHVAVALDAGPGRSSARQLREGIAQLRVLGLRLGELDRYLRPPDALPGLARSDAKLTVRLNGASYLSEKTRDAYTATLARRVPDRSDEKESTQVSTDGSTGTPPPASRSPSEQHGPAKQEAPLVATFAGALAHLHDHQRELLQLQRQLVTGQLELSRALLEQAATRPEEAARVGMLEAMQRQQTALLQQHEQFVANQMRYAEALLKTIDRQAAVASGEPVGPRTTSSTDGPAMPATPSPASESVAPVAEVTPPPLLEVPASATAPQDASSPAVPAPPVTVGDDVDPAPAASIATDDFAELQAAMLEVVSEKTGYPVETLELNMDIEADLGIDSIKRVEILGAMQERFASLPALRPDELVALRTLQEVVDYLRRFDAEVPTHASPPAGVTTNGRVALAVPRLLSLPPPDTLEVGLPAGYCVVVTDDGTEISGALARELVSRGSPTVVLRFPDSLVTGRAVLPHGAAEVVLDTLDDERIGKALGEIAAQYGPIGTFIHVHPRDAQPGFVDPGQEQLLRAVFLAATRLRPSLEECARLGRGSFVVVTRLDGALGTGDGDFDPAGGGLYGLAKTIRQEWPAVFCRAIDLAPSLDADGAARAVLAELADPDERLVEVGYGMQGRVTLTVEDAVTVGD